MQWVLIMISDDLNFPRMIRNGINSQGQLCTFGETILSEALKEASLYRRGTAFFSSSAIVSYADSIARFFNDRDSLKIEILCYPRIQNKKLLETLQMLSDKQRKDQFLNEMANDIVLKAVAFSRDPKNKENREYQNDLLAYLIAKGKFEIRFALPKRFNVRDHWENPAEMETDRTGESMYHCKDGYFIFSDDSQIAFTGSVNESLTGHEKSHETAMIFKDTGEADEKIRFDDIKRMVDSDWEKMNPNIEVFELEKETLNIIKDLSPDAMPRKDRYKKTIKGKNSHHNHPALWDHQSECIRTWFEKDCRGIFALCTGSGKTRTALVSMESLKKQKGSGLVLITVPYQSLAQQWVSELRKKNISSIEVYGSQHKWIDQVKAILFSHSFDKIPVFICVNKTFKSSLFQDLLEATDEKRMQNSLLVVDECHHFNRPQFHKKLPEVCQYRMGLSATPYEKDEERYLEKYFSNFLYSYSISDAIRDEILVPYEYLPIAVRMNGEECISYATLGRKILAETEGGRLDFSALSESARKTVSSLLAMQSVILGSLEDKFQKLVIEIEKSGPESNTLFYCSGGKKVFFDEDGVTSDDDSQLVKVMTALNERKWKVGRIIAEDSLRERESVLKQFGDKVIDCLVSINILDEGIDLPDCNKAYLLTSQSNERQSVQRRGRVLRKSKTGTKKKATIVDFIITNVEVADSFTEGVMNREKDRFTLFQKDAMNKNELWINRFFEDGDR